VSLRIATRSSRLARVQAELVGRALTRSLAAGFELVPVDTAGEAGDKQRFVRGVERELIDGGAEIGVHSAKDLPGTMTPGLAIAAVPGREDPRDAWVGPGGSLEEIPHGARVGTSSLRRRSQLLGARPDLVPVELRGNVDTRIGKLAPGEVDGIVLAMAGLKRLGREDEVSFAFSLEQMTPAAGQGTLAIQARVPSGIGARVRPVNDERAERELTAERAAVVGLDADCSSPVGIHACHEGDGLVIEGFAGSADGSKWVRDRVEGDPVRPEALGHELARRMKLAGAAAILADASTL
jgi:hydroxymethylbilane synthase